MQVSLVRLCFLMVLLTTALAEDETDEPTAVTTNEPVPETTLAPPVASSAPSDAPSVANFEAPLASPPAAPPVKQHAFLDGNTLLPLLLASGGPPGEFPIENDQKRTSDDNCSAWLYEYTNSFPDGVLRHEHGFYHEDKQSKRQARGVYAKMQPADKPSFVIEYDKNDSLLNITATILKSPNLAFLSRKDEKGLHQLFRDLNARKTDQPKENTPVAMSVMDDLAVTVNHGLIIEYKNLVLSVERQCSVARFHDFGIFKRKYLRNGYYDDAPNIKYRDIVKSLEIVAGRNLVFQPFGIYLRLKSKCNTTEWSVMICQQSDGLFKDYVVHGHQDPPCREVPTIPPPTNLGNGSTLEELVGIDSLKKSELPDDYDLSPLLLHFGGAPGEVVSAWNRNFTPLEAPADPKERPLPDVKRTSWLYDYRAVNSPHSVRFEHASLRFKGQPDEFVDVRGIIYWRTSRGDFRIEYHQDDVGLRSKLDLAECIPIRGMWMCTYSTKEDDA